MKEVPKLLRCIRVTTSEEERKEQKESTQGQAWKLDAARIGKIYAVVTASLWIPSCPKLTDTQELRQLSRQRPPRRPRIEMRSQCETLWQGRRRRLPATARDLN